MPVAEQQGKRLILGGVSSTVNTDKKSGLFYGFSIFLICSVGFKRMLAQLILNSFYCMAAKESFLCYNNRMVSLTFEF